MSLKKLTILCFVALSSLTFAQATITNGPELENDRDNKMISMFEGDENSYFCYRVRTNGKGTSYIIEKYDKTTLKPLFSKEINLEEEDRSKIEDILYSNGKIYIFRREYDKKIKKMTLFYQTVSEAGVVSLELKEVVNYSSDNYEFVNFDIVQNPGKTKFLIKASYKVDEKDKYKTDLILMDAVAEKKIWTKVTNIKGTKDFNGFNGIMLDENGIVYYSYSYEASNSTETERRYALSMDIIYSASQNIITIDLPFDNYFLKSDINIYKSNNNQITIGGFLNDPTDYKRLYIVKMGVFCFKVDLLTKKVISKSVQTFDDKLLTALENNPFNFQYKLDYIIPVRDDYYFVGVQHSILRFEETNIENVRTIHREYKYKYRNILIAKLNAKGKFEWIKNSPLKIDIEDQRFNYLFKQYIVFATAKNLYLLNVDHKNNLEQYGKSDFKAKDLKPVKVVHGSNFICATISLEDGNVKERNVIMKNDDYCFAPIQERRIQFIFSSHNEIFVPGKNNEIVIYTEDKGKDRFSKIKFE